MRPTIGGIVTDSTKATVNLDLLEKLPLETASKISLQGGGVLLFVAIVGVCQMNANPKWQIDSWLIFSLLIGATLLGLAGTLARMYDARLRVQLALKLIDKDTSDAEATKRLFENLKELLGGDPVVRLAIIQPVPDAPIASIIPNGKNAKAGPGQ